MNSSSLSRLGVQQFQITSLLVNPQGRLGLFGLLNLLQETAWTHADKWGFGMNEMEKDSLYWVLTRQLVTMEKWPRYGESVKVSTWLRPPEGAFLSREFLIQNSAGDTIGKCSTTWVALDRATKKILPVAQLRPWADIALTDTTELIPDKISAQGNFEALAKYRVRNSDLDVNQHVNNTRYSQWILDSIPIEFHKKLRLRAYAVNFLAETHLGDKVEVERNLECPAVTNADRGVTLYRGRRLGDDRILFTASLTWEKI